MLDAKDNEGSRADCLPEDRYILTCIKTTVKTSWSYLESDINNRDDVYQAL